ncbi:MAG: agmatine deiminase family protein [Acidimicrobiales bacterium]
MTPRPPADGAGRRRPRGRRARRPPHVACFDATVEVPYVNLHVGNAGVFVPLGGAAADGEMLDRIADCFPGRQVVGVPGTVLAYGGGGVRTLTCPIPAGSAD